MELQSEAEAFLHSVCVEKLDSYLVPVFVQASPVFPVLQTGYFIFVCSYKIDDEYSTAL